MLNCNGLGFWLESCPLSLTAPSPLKRHCIYWYNKRTRTKMTRTTLSKPAFTSGPFLIKCHTYNPLQSSRLGDLGYHDVNGQWQVILNIFDTYSCQKAGV